MLRRIKILNMMSTSKIQKVIETFGSMYLDEFCKYIVIAKKLSTVQAGDFDEIFSHQLLQTMYIVGGGDDERRQPSHRAVFDI